jgi:hypothetical protein
MLHVHVRDPAEHQEQGYSGRAKLSGALGAIVAIVGITFKSSDRLLR